MLSHSLTIKYWTNTSPSVTFEAVHNITLEMETADTTETSVAIYFLNYIALHATESRNLEDLIPTQPTVKLTL
jgi:hypothetical protein